MDWSGKLRVEGNEIIDARMHGLFNPEQGIQEKDGNELGFNFITSGNSLNFCIKVKEPASGTLHFESRPCTFSLPLAEITRNARTMFEAPIDQFLEVFTVCLEKLPSAMSFNFSAQPPDAPQVPYFIRVRQLDEAKAWTSPFYVTRA